MSFLERAGTEDLEPDTGQEVQREAERTSHGQTPSLLRQANPDGGTAQRVSSSVS